MAWRSSLKVRSFVVQHGGAHCEGTRKGREPTSTALPNLFQTRMIVRFWDPPTAPRSSAAAACLLFLKYYLHQLELVTWVSRVKL